ncbi:hypothetical protein E2C01_057171 [Portunus trituberculatus]|uniref:Uncharacterized protein n=1 Tax=Portunus trituberculatus TaxID=210409 RepID=A0A5B7H1L9_PORTR|nr:hypothetical protein [Portunus trituberculatus]
MSANNLEPCSRDKRSISEAALFGGRAQERRAFLSTAKRSNCLCLHLLGAPTEDALRPAPGAGQVPSLNLPVASFIAANYWLC